MAHEALLQQGYEGLYLPNKQINWLLSSMNSLYRFGIS